jgi:apolipoprotein N-acyltransferase
MEVLVAVTSLVLGIISVALNLVLPIPIIGQIIYMAIGVIAIVLAVKGKQNEPEKKGMAVAGLVLGIIGTAWAAIALVVCIGILGVGATAATELEGMFETMD